MSLKRVLTSLGMMAVLFVSSFHMTVQAANVVEVPATEVDSVYNQDVQSNTLEGWAQGPQIYSE